MPYEEWNSITTEDINKGIVIVDKAITYDNGQETGIVPDFNEYVWVPIPDFENFKPTAWNGPHWTDNYKVGEAPIAIAPTTDIEKEGKYWNDSTTVEYTNMKDSVEQYKGFYIGRYEASDNGSGIPQSKRNILPWINVTQTTAVSASTKNTTKNIHLIYGIEWDSTLNWLIGNAVISSSEIGKTKTMELADMQTNSNSWGNYTTSTGNAETGKGILQNTGYNESWKANNIYDLAGNVYEWTQERYSTGASKTLRGGYYYPDTNYYPVVSRYSSNEENWDDRSRFSN